ncbi:unnamed protein product [Pleuronectes platessa]|uniref:Uncharacterized protein n=1 Tax=Pleuronectes platessa TaxID=8262 RepID=A0A9N7V4X2_PLEPL|nr:unnamed protein product [Pleuronectes platessa]
MFRFSFQYGLQMCSSCSSERDLLLTIAQQTLKWFHSHTSNLKKKKRKQQKEKLPPNQKKVHLIPKLCQFRKVSLLSLGEGSGFGCLLLELAADKMGWTS